METKRKPNGYWTLDKCLEDALRFETRRSWKLGTDGGYWAAKRQGWLDLCSDHMLSRSEASRLAATKWSAEDCKRQSALYSTVSDWRRSEDKASYWVAQKNGWIDECCAHMQPADGASDNNVVYLWQDTTTGLHKIGVTSERLGEQRIGGKNYSMDPRIVFMLKVDDARAVEAELLKLGTDPELESSIDGHTEFRVLTNEELGKAVSTAYQYAVAA